MTRRFIEKSLTLDVYIIGYKTQGESIILIVQSDEFVDYTCVIDCYEYNDLNKTIEILDSLKISHIDMICWTHPDIDHSYGIDTLLSKYANGETIILIPEGLDGDRESYEYNERVKETFELINDNIKSNRKDSFNAMSVSDSKNLVLHEYVHTKEEKAYYFEVKSVAPSSSLIRRRDQYTTEPKKNDYSIALHVIFGELQLFLGGDIENVNISRMNTSYIPKSYHLLKIPHHTSFSSDELLQLLDKENKTAIVCSTIYRSSQLPDIELIELYRDYSKEFFCTGCITAQDDNYDYGYVHISYNILEKISNTILEGNASVIFSDSVL